MVELMCSPEGSTQPQSFNLQTRIATLLALGRVFSAGGEKLDSTLTELIKTFSWWLEEKEGASPEDQELLNKLIKVQEEKDKKRLVFEFNRLFVGPGSPIAPPYESVFRSEERLVMKDSTLDVRRWYSREGLSSAGVSNEPDDYIATELEYAAYLLANASELYFKNQPAKAKVYIESYNAFYRAHLAIWLPPFVQSINESTREQLFIILGKIILKTVSPVK